MDQTRRRQLSIARELRTWGPAVPRLLTKINEVVKLPQMTAAQTAGIEAIAELVRTLLLSIREAVDSDDYDRLIAATDRLREEVVKADETLDRLLKPETPH